MDDRTSDAELVAMARSRDREAFGVLVERHQPMAQRVAFGVVGQGSIAAELANEAMLQAYLSLDRLRDAATFQSWIHGIVLNVCRSYIRDRKKAPLSYEEVMGGVRHEGLAIVDIEPSPQEVAESQELHRVVIRAVEVPAAEGQGSDPAVLLRPAQRSGSGGHPRNVGVRREEPAPQREGKTPRSAAAAPHRCRSVGYRQGPGGEKDDRSQGC